MPKNSLSSLPLSLPTARLPSRHTFSWLRFRKVLLQAERWKLQGWVCLDTIKHTQTVPSDSERITQGLLYRAGLTLWVLSFYQSSVLISSSSRWLKKHIAQTLAFKAPACQSIYLKMPTSTLSSRIQLTLQGNTATQFLFFLIWAKWVIPALENRVPFTHRNAQKSLSTVYCRGEENVRNLHSQSNRKQERRKLYTGAHRSYKTWWKRLTMLINTDVWKEVWGSDSNVPRTTASLERIH